MGYSEHEDAPVLQGLQFSPQLSPEQKRHLIEGQFKPVNRVLVQLMDEIDHRTYGSMYKIDGVGMCYIDKKLARHGQGVAEYWHPNQKMSGPASQELFAAQDEISAITGGERYTDRKVCEFHRIGVGCVLGNAGLRPPFCLGVIENPEELAKFGINGRQLGEEILNDLGKIEKGGQTLEGDRIVYNPHANDELTQDTITKYRQLLEKIQQFPEVETHEYQYIDVNGIRRLDKEDEIKVKLAHYSARIDLFRPVKSVFRKLTQAFMR